MAIRSTASYLLASASFHGLIRTTAHYLFEVSSRFAAKRVTSHYVFGVASVHTAFYLEPLESNSLVFDLQPWLLSVTGIMPEFNPYRPDIPDELYDMSQTLYNHFAENQKITREQHNITQAGDTTFPWQMFITPHSTQIYTLGSVGRFYHEDYGLIHARYVQFDLMDVDAFTACPVGFILTEETLDWRVTNRLDLSNPYLALGINASFVLPKDGEYGWVVVDGVNLQRLENESDSFERAEALGWSSTGKVSNNSPGVVLGRRLGRVKDKELIPGSVYIKLEALTPKAILDSLGELTDELEQIQEDIENLKNATEIVGTLATIQASLTSLTARISLEERNRKNADTAINNRISNLGFVTGGQLAAAVNQLAGSINAVKVLLTSQITAAQNLAQEAYDLAAAASPAAIANLQLQITTLADLFAADKLRPKGKFPVVDGAVPPNLVYLDDGSLVFTETY